MFSLRQERAELALPVDWIFTKPSALSVLTGASPPTPLRTEILCETNVSSTLIIEKMLFTFYCQIQFHLFHRHTKANRQNVETYTLAVVFLPTIFILHLSHGRNKPFLFRPFYFLPLSVFVLIQIWEEGVKRPYYIIDEIRQNITIFILFVLV